MDASKNDEIDLLEELVIVLEPFYEFTEKLSGSKYVTSSIIIPTYFLLLRCLDSFYETSLQKETQDTIESLKSSLISRCSCYLNKIEILTATFLDPRFRSFRFFSDVKEKAKYLANVTQYLMDQAKTSQLVTQPEKNASTSETPSQASLRKKFNYLDIVDQADNDKPLEINDEISNYSNMSIKLNENSCPLEFYSKNSNQFLILSKIAKKLFCITDSSVSCEQLFSKAGEIISDKRNRLSPQLAEFITLLDQIKFFSILL